MVLWWNLYTFNFNHIKVLAQYEIVMLPLGCTVPGQNKINYNNLRLKRGHILCYFKSLCFSYIQVDYWAPAMSTVAGVLGIVTGLFTLMLPETLGRNLDDTVNQVDADSE